MAYGLRADAVDEFSVAAETGVVGVGAQRCCEEKENEEKQGRVCIEGLRRAKPRGTLCVPRMRKFEVDFLRFWYGDWRARPLVRGERVVVGTIYY